MGRQNYYNIQGLKVKTNFDVKFYGESIPSYFSVKPFQDPDLTVFEVKDISEDGFEMQTPPYTLTKDKTMLHRYTFIIPCKFSLTDLDGSTEIRFTPFYRKFIGVKHILHNILQIKFLQKNKLMVHAACVKKDEQGIIATGWDKSGKTTTATMIDDQLLSDDITITDGKMFYAYPRTVRKFIGFKFPLQSKLSYIPYFNRFLKKIIGYEEKIDITPKANSVKPKFIFAIKKGSKSVRKIQKEETIRFLANQSMYHGAFSDPKFLLFAYASYFDFDIPTMFKKRMRILEELCSKTKNYMLVSEDKKELAEEMRKILEKS